MKGSNVVAYGLAKGLDLGGLRSCFQEQEQGHEQERYRMTDYRDAFHVQQTQGGDLFLFPYGVVVLWGLSTEEEAGLHRTLAPFMIEPLARPVEDRFTFSADAEQIRIHHDHIHLTRLAPLEMLALSQGIAQSTKLTELELQAGRTIDSTIHIPRSLAETGSTRLSRRDIARMRGQLILVESDINHHYALLDTPEFFWEYPELEGLYQQASGYLDLQARVEILNKKLAMIHKLFGMLADEQNHKHSSLLEWIIIWLIAVEILIFLGHDLLKLF